MVTFPFLFVYSLAINTWRLLIAIFGNVQNQKLIVFRTNIYKNAYRYRDDLSFFLFDDSYHTATADNYDTIQWWYFKSSHQREKRKHFTSSVLDFDDSYHTATVEKKYKK